MCSAGSAAKPKGFKILRTANKTTVRGFCGGGFKSKSPPEEVLEAGRDGRAMLDAAITWLQSVFRRIFSMLLLTSKKWRLQRKGRQSRRQGV